MSLRRIALVLPLLAVGMNVCLLGAEPPAVAPADPAAVARLNADLYTWETAPLRPRVRLYLVPSRP